VCWCARASTKRLTARALLVPNPKPPPIQQNRWYPGKWIINGIANILNPFNWFWGPNWYEGFVLVPRTG
jgi:hypothetical protein